MKNGKRLELELFVINDTPALLCNDEIVFKNNFTLNLLILEVFFRGVKRTFSVQA